jgi:iron complex transport system substrate-binding protein
VRPQRIVCLSTETVEVLYALGQEHRIAGISGYTVRPPQARREKPKVSGFSTARLDKILAVDPDLVLAFSDLQADMCRDLVRAGVEVHHFNQRDVAGIFAMIATVGRLVGAEEKAAAYVAELEARVECVRAAAATLPRRPRVYFEEWDAPQISGIRWVSELIAIAGGDDVFPELATRANARERIVADPMEVVRRAPDIIIGSWCGKKFQSRSVRARPGWEALPAVREDRVYEIKSAIILSPGPAALTDGLSALSTIMRSWVPSASD